MLSVSERLSLKEEVLKKAFENYDLNLRCAAPGIVQSFDAEKQTVVVQLAIKEKIKCNTPEFVAEYGSNVGSVAVSLLVDVPIVFPSAGGFSLTLPVVAGDECLVIFSDTCIDGWYENGCPEGEPQDQKSLRRHDLSDAFAILGIKSQPNVLLEYSGDAIELRNNEGTNKIRLSSSGIELIFGDSKLTVNGADIKLESEYVHVEAGNAAFVKGGVATVVQEKDFITHVHMGVQSGNQYSGPVV